MLPTSLHSVNTDSVSKRFRFGSRIVTATGTQSGHMHLHVLGMRIQSTFLKRAIQFLLLLVPRPFAYWVQDRFPKWCLPEKIVFKKQKEGWDEELDREKAAYAKLRPIQGITVPRFYGATAYNDTRAMILSDIGGACVASLEGAVLDEKDFILQPAAVQGYDESHQPRRFARRLEAGQLAPRDRGRQGQDHNGGPGEGGHGPVRG